MELLDELKEEHEKCRGLEKRIRNILYGVIITFGGFLVLAIGNNMVLQKTVKDQGSHIDVIRKNYVTYDNFFLFNRTYEMQLLHSQAMLNGNEKELKTIQDRYNELRSLIIRQPTTRGWDD